MGLGWYWVQVDHQELVHSDPSGVRLLEFGDYCLHWIGFLDCAESCFQVQAQVQARNPSGWQGWVDWLPRLVGFIQRDGLRSPPASRQAWGCD